MLLSNPLLSPLAPTVAATLAALLATALGSLLLAVRGSLATLRQSVLFARWCTWLAIASVFSLAVLSGPFGVVLLASGLALQAAREYSRLAHLPRVDGTLLALVSALAPVAALVLPLQGLFLVAMVLPLLATLPALVADDAEHGFQRVSALLLGFSWLALPPGSLVLLATHPRGGAGLLLTLGLAVALADVGGFLVGKRFGRSRLAPRLSPGKTFVGLVGSLLGAALGVSLFASLLPTGVPAFAVVLVVAVGAPWGDLLESLVKRSAGAKDAGTWLPGFGGLLDRIDSLLVVLPLALLLLEVLS